MTDRTRWIIIGAGSAGCVFANRLSADPSNDVVLLDDGPGLEPAAVPTAISGPSFFEAMAEPGRLHVDLLATRAVGIEPELYQRGRGVGGSSAVNAMVALRGDPELYRSWGWHDADEAWSRVQIPTTTAHPDQIGAIDRALRTHDLGRAADMTRRDGHRVTSAEAYLWPVLNRPNLTVAPNHEVDTITFVDRSATGVRLRDGTELAADRVLVCAGAIHSPTVLLRSGVDTPGVGAELQDHPSAVFTLQLRDEIPQDRAGLPVASVLHQVVNGNVLQLLPLSHLGPAPESAGLGALMAAVMTPVGRAGSVTIDVAGRPIIDFALLDDERDVAALVDAVDLALEVITSSAFTDICSAAYVDDRGTTIDALSSNEAIEDWARGSCGDYVHATSTCAMGRVVDDNGSVYGYEHLFVGDASVFPHIPDANTHLPTTMLAERLAMRLR